MPRIATCGPTTFYRDEGNPSCPVLVLAHPVGSDHGIWDSLVPLLLGKFRIIRYDLHGHGATDCVSDMYSLSRLSDDILSLLDALGIDTFSFCGISLGGLTGLTIAARSGERLRRLVVANAAAKLPLTAEQWNERIALVRENGMDSLVDGMIQRMFSPSFRQSNGASFHTEVRTFLGTSPIGYAAGLTVLRDSDLRDDLAKITCETVVVGSANDLAVPQDASQRMAEMIPRASLATLPGGHFSALEDPDGLANVIFEVHGI